MFEAAREHDDILHTNALAGFLVGAVLGIALVAAVSALTICTGGLGGVLIGVALGVSAGLGAEALMAIGEQIGGMFSSTVGKIDEGVSPNVFINGRAAARTELSSATCMHHVPVPSLIADGSCNVAINGYAAARKGDHLTCGAKIETGSSNVFIGGGTHRYLPVADEIPQWVRNAAEGALFLAGLYGGLANLARYGAQAGLKAALPCAMSFGVGVGISIVVDRYIISPGISAITGLIGNPVDAVNGRKVLLNSSETDFELPSHQPLQWSRFYASDLNADSVLGQGWRLPWEMTLQRRHGFIYLQDPQGREIPFSDVAPGESTFSPSEQLWLVCSEGGHFLIRTIEDVYYYFGALEGDAPTPLTCQQDLYGHYHYFRRDDVTGLLTDITTDDGLWLHLSYHPQHAHRLSTVERIIDGCPVETLAHYTYDAAARLVTVTDRRQKVTRRFAYDEHGTMVQHENALGLASHYQWAEVDGARRVVEHWTSDGEHYQFDYDVKHKVSRVTDVLGREAALHYNASGYLTDVHDFDDKHYQFQRDASDNAVGVTLPDGRQLAFQYDDYSRLVAFVDPEQRRTDYRYHFTSERITAVNTPDGQQWQADYNDQGSLVREHDTLGRTTAYAYTDDGLPYAITDAAGNTRYLRFNAQAQLIESIDCSGKRTQYQYDDRFYLCRVINALGEETRLVNDAGGNVTEIRYPDGRREQYQYNALGQPLAHIDPARATTRWRYTPRGLPLEEQDAYYRSRKVDYDRALRPVSVVNENNVRWCFTWNSADQLQEETRFDGLTRRYTYDDRGQLIRLVELGVEENLDKVSPHYWTAPTIGAANGDVASAQAEPVSISDAQRPRRETRFDYDARGRLVARHSNDYCDVSHYDDSDRLTLIERVPTEAGKAKSLDASSLRFEYDNAGRLIGEGMGDHTLAYAYDALDNLTALTLPDGRQLNSFYYGSGHLLQLNLDALEISHFERDDLHREIMRSQGALTSRFGFDNRGRKAWQFASPLDSRTLSPRHNPSVVAGELIDREDNAVYRRYHYTSTGELASVEDKARPTQRYDYDLTGRLKRYWPAPLREEWFGYDQAANRILPGNDSSPRHMTVGDNRQRDVEGYRYAYDAWGNTLQRITQDEEQHFEYDSDNRLIRAQVYRHHQQVSDTRYHYDPLGRRIRKVVTRHDPHTATSSTTHTHFLWQGLRLLSDTQHQPEQPTLTRLYCYEQGSYAPLARIDTTGDDLNSPQVYYFHTDVLGTPKEVTNSAGQIVWQADYKAWGEIDLYRVHQIDQPLRFQGQYADDETGLYYTTFRYYDPHSGRFTTQDPIGLAGGLNLYQYAPNPTGWVDPLGLASCAPSKGFSRRNGITRRWVDRLTGKTPADVHDHLTSKGWAITRPQAGNDRAIQHIVYVKTTKSGTTYKLDYHPGGSPSQPNIHGNDYWKVYKSTGTGPDEVLGRIGYGSFKNYDLIKDSPVYIDGVLINGV